MLGLIMNYDAPMILGAHESTAGALENAVPRALADGCETFQMFTASSRQWRARVLGADDTGAFRKAVRASGLGPVAAHASYLINLAAPEGEPRTRSLAALADELARCARLAVPYLVLHPGSHLGHGESLGIARVAAGLDQVLAGAPRGVAILLENTAGQGACVGHRFAHLGAIFSACRRRRRLGVCLDTQHAFAAGYDLGSAAGYRATFAELDATVGLHHLRAFHLNDSKRPLGCRVDRHENIGLGFLGLEPFRRLVNDRRFAALPGYLETPPLDGADSFARNLKVLRSLVTPATRRAVPVTRRPATR